MAISINWGTKVITVPKADTVLVQASPEIRELDLNLFRLALKDLEDDETGMPFLNTHSHNTSVLLGGILYARLVEIINGYTVTFEDGQYAVNLFGANSNVGDVVNVNQVSVRANNSAGLVQTRELELIAFQDGVVLDQLNGFSGTAYPAGTPLHPVNNVADAESIATSRGIKIISLRGIFNPPPGGTANGLLFQGISTLNTDRVVFDGTQVFSGCDYRDVWVSGVGTYGGTFQRCFVENVTGLLGGAKDSGFLGSFSFIAAAPPNGFQFFDCHTTDSVDAKATLNINPAVNVLMHRCSGRWVISGCTGGTHVLNMAGAEVELDGTCTGGTVIIRGTVRVIDNSAGTTVNTDATASFAPDDRAAVAAIPTAVWGSPVEGTFTAAEVLRLMSAVLAGKVSGAPAGPVVIRDIGDTKPRVTATVDANGNRTAVVLDKT